MAPTRLRREEGRSAGAASKSEHDGAQEEGWASGWGAANRRPEAGELVRVESGEIGSLRGGEVGAFLLSRIEGAGGPQEVAGIQRNGDEAVVAGFFGRGLIFLAAARWLGGIREAGAGAFGNEELLAAQAESERQVLHRDEGDEQGSQGRTCEFTGHLGDNVVDSGGKSILPDSGRAGRSHVFPGVFSYLLCGLFCLSAGRSGR